jgi:tetratricopeptide (TPR) repeat protein
MANSMARIALIAAVLCSGGLAVGAEPGTPTSSTRHLETFAAAQAALAAQDHAVVIAKAREVLASARKTADDIYIAHNFLTRAARDPAAVIAGMEGMLESGFAMGTEAENALRKQLATVYFGQKDYPMAIKYGTALASSGAADDEIQAVLGESHYHSGNYTESVKIYEQLVGDDQKAGRRPDRRELLLLQSSHDKAGNQQGARAALEDLARHHPDPNTWLVLLQEFSGERLDSRQKLHFHRLLESTGNLKRGSDFLAYAAAANSLGLPDESRRVLEAALAAKVFDQESDRSQAVAQLAAARERAESYRAELTVLEAEARSASSGNLLVTVGAAHLSFGQYPQAIEALKAGIAKGGLNHPVDAELTLGIAQLKGGQKAEAGQTLQAIAGADEVMQRIAKLWALHAS